MKSLTVRLPDSLRADIEAEPRSRNITKSDAVRERLLCHARSDRALATASIADLIGSVDGLPADLSRRKKWYLKRRGYAHK
jgi:hypothetical protein